MFLRGAEYPIGKNMRVAPTDNRTGNEFGNWPYGHRAKYDPATGRKGCTMREKQGEGQTIVEPVVVEYDDITLFDTVDDAIGYLEVWAVRDGRLRAFDGIGRPLQFSIVTEPNRLKLGPWTLKLYSHERIRIDLDEQQPARPDELKNMLTDGLRRYGFSDSELAGQSLADLLRLAQPSLRVPG